MTRKELIQFPSFWQNLYDNECIEQNIEEKERKIKVIKCARKHQTFDEFVKWWWHG